MRAHTQQIPAPDSLFADLHTFEFDDYHLSEDQTVLASVRMFRDSGLTATFRIDDKVSCIYSVLKNSVRELSRSYTQVN